MKRNKSLLLIIAVLILVLLFLIALSTVLSAGKSDAGTTTGSSNTTPSTHPTQTETEPTSSTGPSDPEPTEPTPPATEPPPPPTDPNKEYIGNLYTREQLEAMDTKTYTYGPGVASNGNRPEIPLDLQNYYGKYNGNFIAPDNGNIYLTFDCGYEYYAKDEQGNQYRVTERILDVLKEKNVKAVFFITMSFAKNQSDLVRRMIDEGHTVGNHSYNHLVMSDLTIDKMVYEVMSVHEYVLEHYNYEMTLFRPPTGAYSTQSLAVLQSLGYKNVHWSFAYVDWETDNQPTEENALNTIKSRVHSGAIYLLHTVSTTNAKVLDDAINFFRAEGYNLELFQ